MPLFFLLFILLYGLGNTYDDNIKPFQRMQKKAICVIFFPDFDVHTCSLFFELKLLQLQVHIKLQTLFFMHQIFIGKSAKTTDSFFN